VQEHNFQAGRSGRSLAMTPRPPTLYQVNRLPQSERSWDLFAGELYRRGETGTLSYKACNPFRRHQWGPPA